MGGIAGKLAAVDCTKHQQISKRFEVKGFPTIKYFKDGAMAFDAGDAREEAAILKFMADPKEPPPPPPPEAAWKEEESDVVHLTEEQWQGLQGAIFLKHLKSSEFEHYMRYKETVLVMFYAPWCGHCKSMKADYAQAAEQLTNAKVKHVLATVDATLETELAQKYQVRGYPTLKLFSSGVEVEDYKGGRTKKDIVAYITEKSKATR